MSPTKCTRAICSEATIDLLRLGEQGSLQCLQANPISYGYGLVEYSYNCPSQQEESLKLIIQIPCFNEAGTLAIALAALPPKVAGFASVEWLVIDDGSHDETAAIAKANGVHHVVRQDRKSTRLNSSH